MPVVDRLLATSSRRDIRRVVPGWGLGLGEAVHAADVSEDWDASSLGYTHCMIKIVPAGSWCWNRATSDG